jgi:hypothetical protein
MWQLPQTNKICQSSDNAAKGLNGGQIMACCKLSNRQRMPPGIQGVAYSACYGLAGNTRSGSVAGDKLILSLAEGDFYGRATQDCTHDNDGKDVSGTFLDLRDLCQEPLPRQRSVTQHDEASRGQDTDALHSNKA